MTLLDTYANYSISLVFEGLALRWQKGRDGRIGFAHPSPDHGTISVAEVAWGYAGVNISNNVVEYRGLIASLQRAEALRHLRVCVQTDSLLVAQQTKMHWACRQTALRPLLDEVLTIKRRMEANGVMVLVEHIYREHNKTADKLANHAVSTKTSCDWSGHSPVGNVE